MTTWREELLEAIKTRSERDAEEEAKRRKRVEEALKVADEALAKAGESLAFARDQLAGKGQPVALREDAAGRTLELHGQALAVALDRDEAVLRIAVNEAKAKEFDFAKDRHIAPRDVEEYVGRRLVELVRAAHKAAPW